MRSHSRVCTPGHTPAHKGTVHACLNAQTVINRHASTFCQEHTHTYTLTIVLNMRTLCDYIHYPNLDHFWTSFPHQFSTKLNQIMTKCNKMFHYRASCLSSLKLPKGTNKKLEKEPSRIITERQESCLTRFVTAVDQFHQVFLDQISNLNPKKS